MPALEPQVRDAPFRPQTLFDMQARYSRAVETLIDDESLDLGLQTWPVANPAHVFDFADGLRLVVSREAQPSDMGPARIIHFSASAYPGSMMEGSVLDLTLSLESFLGIAAERFRLVSGDLRPAVFLGMYDVTGSAQWWIDDTEPPC